MRQVEISHRDIADCAARMSLMPFKVEELAPRENFNHISASPGDILNYYCPLNHKKASPTS